MAFIYQSKNKNGTPHPKWRFQYTDYKGRRRTGTGTTSRTETELIAEQLEAEHSLIKNGYKEPPKKSHSYKKKYYIEIADEYISWGKIQGGRNSRPWSTVHIKNRVRHLNWWSEKLNLTFLGDLVDCQREVELLIRSMFNDGFSGKTVSNYVESLKSFCSYCVNRDYIEDNPLRRLSGIDTKPKILKRSLTQDEVSRLLSVTTEVHYNLLFRTALFSGLRVNELRSLQRSDLDATACALTLHSEWTKNRKDGLQPIPEDLFNELLSFAKSNKAISLYNRYYRGGAYTFPTDPLFYISDNICDVINRHYKKAGIPKYTKEGKVDFHCLRVTFINNLINSGVSPKIAQVLARHSSVDMTFNTYGRTNLMQLRDYVESLNNIT